MTTIATGRRARHTAAVVLAAAATAVGMLSAAPAHAADQYIALAIGFVNENPPVTMAGGSAISGTEQQAAVGSLTNCSGNGAGHCVTQVIAKNECAAAASNDYGERTGATGASRGVAESKAKALLQNQQGAKVIVSGCANGSTPPPPNDPPPPPPPPKLGPTVSFDTVIGGLVAHITDRSGVSSQCTYATDGYNRAFGLAANSRYDLRIVPAVPRFRNWTVTITCDNGTSTTATTYF
ncbi:DUF4189 domain-containing protein [Mycolicibacterium flavescens]|uniref:DUF4189 domain-containing protein n=1 Tax=Mycolicibacterium flavescens TaxID=1776 RepID=A0A1E3RRV3_MYCFV|nr:DUF4189 domain-containing protein [Mycolicibacterium flavescens]MCV7279967.1 DUF4189 domain-containing protein [Mycolicibacterium flavescens]ODQ92574.1 hypothetical protein BHQ18_02305 [Mycolicibacterium flavescens]